LPRTPARTSVWTGPLLVKLVDTLGTVPPPARASGRAAPSYEHRPLPASPRWGREPGSSPQRGEAGRGATGLPHSPTRGRVWAGVALLRTPPPPGEGTGRLPPAGGGWEGGNRVAPFPRPRERLGGRSPPKNYTKSSWQFRIVVAVIAHRDAMCGNLQSKICNRKWYYLHPVGARRSRTGG